MRTTSRWLAAALLVACATGLPAGGPATAAPARSATIRSVEHVTGRWLRVFVDSPAMGTTVQVDVLLPADRGRPRPTVYLLEGGDSDRPGQSDWTYEGGAVGFFADKDVNVVLPVGGAGSYYTDWQRGDAGFGRQHWETLLTRELPPLLDARFGGNGVNAVLGISMGAQAAITLAERAGPLYRAVAALSGCYTASGPFGQSEIRYILASKYRDADAMWGPPQDPDWRAHDPIVNADALRGKAIYLYSGSGLPGPHETAATPDLVDDAVAGGALETATRACTLALRARLDALSIPATYRLAPTGTHSWPYWSDELTDAWPTIQVAVDRDDTTTAKEVRACACCSRPVH